MRIFSTKRPRGALLALLAIVGVVAVAAVSAGAPAGGGSQVVTSRPDPVSATITDPGTTQSPAKVTFCYDQTVNIVNDTTGPFPDFYLEGYDNGDILNPENAPVVDPNNQNCVQLQFGSSPPSGGGSAVYPRAIALYTIACAVQNAVNGAPVATPPKPSTQGCVRLDGSAISPGLGEIAGPNLVSTSVDSVNNRITYTFDRPLDNAFCPTGSNTGTGCPQSFGYYDSTGSGGSGGQHNGCSILSNTTNQVIVQFGPSCGGPGTDNAGDAVRFFAYSTVRARTQDEFNQTEHLGSPTTVPDLIRATFVSANTFQLEYDRPVNTFVFGCSFISAYTEDGSLYTCSSFARPGSNAAIINVSFSATQNFNDKIVRIVDEGCAVFDLENNACSTVGSIDVRTTNQSPGFTDGPDLRQVLLNSGGNTATFRFDQNINDQGAYYPSSFSFALVDNNGNLSFPVSGSTPAVSGTDVIVQYTGAQLAGAVGGTVFDCSVFDFEGKGGLDADCNPIGMVGLGNPSGTTGTSTTGAGTSGTTTSSSSTTGTSGTSTSGTSTSGTSTSGTGTGTGTGSSTTTTTSGTTGQGSTTGGVIVVTTTSTTTSTTTAFPPRVPSTITGSSTCSLGSRLRCRTTGTVVFSGVSRRARASQLEPGCSGRVNVQVKIGRRTLSARRARVLSNCRYSSTVSIRRSRIGRRTAVRVLSRFLGNQRVRPSTRSRIQTVRF